MSFLVLLGAFWLCSGLAAALGYVKGYAAGKAAAEDSLAILVEKVKGA